MAILINGIKLFHSLVQLPRFVELEVRGVLFTI
jgi:hypothetical protein